jgi:hypothetical protein
LDYDAVNKSSSTSLTTASLRAPCSSERAGRPEICFVSFGYSSGRLAQHQTVCSGPEVELA